MARKVLLIGFISLMLTVLTGCPDSWYEHYLIKGIDLNGAEIKEKRKDKEDNIYEPTLTFVNSVNFVLTYDLEFISYVPTYSSACYATTKGTKYNNELIQETFSLKFNQPFMYDGVTVPAGTNIFGVQNILNETDVFQSYMTFNSTSADRIIAMSDVFIENAKFDTTEYKVIFSCSTTDNKILMDSVNVKFKTK